MAFVDKERWNERYTKGWTTQLHKTLIEHYRLAPLGRALEIACGTGENAVFLAKAGFKVDAIDISDVAIQRAKALAEGKGVRVNFICADLDDFELEEDAYTLVINFYYLNRRLVPNIKKALKAKGLVIFETYNMNHLSLRHDFNPDYLLQDGELLRFFGDFEVIKYEENFNISTLVARKL